MAEPMLIEVDKAQATVAAMFERAGLPPGDAAVLRDALIDAELTGRKGHGLVRIPSLIKQAAGRGSANIHVSRDAGHLVALDGGDALGYLTAHRAAQEAVERLGRLPLVAVGCRNTRHCGALGYYARLVAMKGHFALALANCCPLLAPHGATRAVFGTNPIALACPGPAHPLVAGLSPGGDYLRNRHERPASGPGPCPRAWPLTRPDFPPLLPRRPRRGLSSPLAARKAAPWPFLYRSWPGSCAAPRPCRPITAITAFCWWVFGAMPLPQRVAYMRRWRRLSRPSTMQTPSARGNVPKSGGRQALQKASRWTPLSGRNFRTWRVILLTEREDADLAQIEWANMQVLKPHSPPAKTRKRDGRSTPFHAWTGHRCPLAHVPSLRFFFGCAGDQGEDKLETRAAPLGIVVNDDVAARGGA